MYRSEGGHGNNQLMKLHVGIDLKELLVVIVILGTAAVIVMLSIGGITSTGEAAACSANATTVETALREFDAQVGGNATIVTPALLVSAPRPYLKSFPSSPDYSISIIRGVVMIAAPKSSPPVAYGTAGACVNAGK
jgi:type II secretory pathway pseudopilin PulG